VCVCVSKKREVFTVEVTDHVTKQNHVLNNITQEVFTSQKMFDIAKNMKIIFLWSFQSINHILCRKSFTGRVFGSNEMSANQK
jgi:hypothetical protein